LHVFAKLLEDRLERGLDSKNSFSGFIPATNPAFRELVQTAIREKSEWETDYRIVHPDGPVSDIHVVGHPVLSTSGHLVEFVGPVIDVTERRRHEEEPARQRPIWHISIV
jgi:PAS domain S-box-containing protein